VVGALAEADELERGPRACGPLLPRKALGQDGEGDVLERRQGGKEVEELKYESDAPAPEGRRRFGIVPP